MIRIVLGHAAVVLACCATVLFSGCQTTKSAFPTPTANWQTFQGQLHYTSAAGRSIIGDVVIRRSPHDDFQLEFSSGPGFPLLRLWQSGELARVEGALAHGAWQGSASKPPRHLHAWFRLRDTFAHQVNPRHVSATLAGERFDFHFGN